MNKTVLITGASSGFGKEAVKRFQKEGWNVIATMRNPQKEEELNKLENVLVNRLDVQEQASIENAINEGIQTFGKIDVLINNAGYGLMGVFESVTEDQFKKQFDVNVFGLMRVTQIMLPQFRKNNSGTIVNISSFGGYVALPFGSLYNSSKFAVEGFSEALSHELLPFNIFVKLIEPGGVATNFRTGLDMIKNAISEYDPFVANFFGRYSGTTAHLKKASPEDVADTIYLAATDGTETLRYVIGEDAQFYIDAKTQNDDAGFIKQMRSYFIQ